MVFTFIKNVPFETNLGKVQFTGHLQKGPGDDLIQVYNELQLEPHSETEFLTGRLGNDFSQKELDLVHTYTVVRMVINMYQELLETELSWPTNNRLYLYPHSRTGTGGCFIAEENSIQYFTYAREKKWVYSCRYFDVVAHEAGHAVLNAIKPEWTKDTSQATAAVTEALCDLTAIFAKLYNWDWFTEIHSTNKMESLSIFAPNYGNVLGYKDGIRNFIKQRKGTTSHDMSATFSRAIYKSVIHFIANSVPLNLEEQYDKIKQLITLCLKAVPMSTEKSVDFKQMTQLILALANENGCYDWEAILKQYFTTENIL